MVATSYIALFVLAVALHSAVARPDEREEQLKAKLVPILTTCAKENGDVTLDFIKEFRASKKPADDSISCLLACIYKKIGLLNGEGKFDTKFAHEQAAKYASAEDKSKFETAINFCEKVNSESVSDGAKGCDRAKILRNCFLDKKTELQLVY